MLPVAFDETDAIVLSPCELITYAKDQPEYLPLPTARRPDAVVVYDNLPAVAGRPGGPTVPVISRWRLTDQERRDIADGADLYLMLLTFGQPLQPIRLSVGVDGLAPCPMDPAA